MDIVFRYSCDFPVRPDKVVGFGTPVCCVVDDDNQKIVKKYIKGRKAELIEIAYNPCMPLKSLARIDDKERHSIVEGLRESGLCNVYTEVMALAQDCAAFYCPTAVVVFVKTKPTALPADGNGEIGYSCFTQVSIVGFKSE